LTGLTIALLLAGFALAGLFKEHVMAQFQSALTQQLDQVTARLEFDATGRPFILPQTLSDPRWQRPFSGLYWQVDQITADGKARAGVLRSRSLWDTSLNLDTDTLADGSLHVHETAGPQDSRLLLLERGLWPDRQSGTRWRLIVAGDLRESRMAMTHFTGVLAASLGVLLALLALAAWAQVAVGLKPLQTLQRSLQDVQHARAQRLQGRFPTEIQPLVDDFNLVLEHDAEVVARARTQAGNLAHALKTPLSVLEHAATRALATESNALALQVREQVVLARRQIDWHLARARVAATKRLPGQRTDVTAAIAGLVRVMERVHAGRHIIIAMEVPDSPLFFAGEEQDLHEILGNLLDNACKWAGQHVLIRAARIENGWASRLQVRVEDDGPGIDAKNLDAVITRGIRLDERVPGSGLGLAIAQDLVGLYDGELTLQTSRKGGLLATVFLPATPPSGS
jgi:signal transduction histidine kinase